MAEKKESGATEAGGGLSLTLDLPKYLGYVDYALSTPVVLKLSSARGETSELRLVLRDEAGLIVPYETTVSVPFESTVEVAATGVFSPVLLAESCDRRTLSVEGVVFDGKEAVLSVKRQVEVLPYDFWEGAEGNAERLAAFVRPGPDGCARILEEAGKRLKKWGEAERFAGYGASNKNTARRVSAAVYAALKARETEKSGKTDLSAPLSAYAENLLKTGIANPLELALFATSCLEAAGLHPVIAVGKQSLGVGVWLTDSCFLETVTDDAETVGKYVAEGINNLSFFDVDDLFNAKSVAFTPSETHFNEKLKEGRFDYFVDVRRCRLAGIRPLPVRTKGLRGFELVKEAETSSDASPAALPEYRSPNLDGKLPKNKQWERRLLDFSPRNPLLNFTGRNALHVRTDEPDVLLARLSEGKELVLKPDDGEAKAFGVSFNAQERELNALEEKNGRLRVFASAEELAETARGLLRRNREADEETGAKILYLALAFLQYRGKDDASVRRAPLLLAPVRIRRAKGNEEFAVVAEEGEIFANATLFEYLKQEFNVDVRGLSDDVASLKISEIVSMVLSETQNLKGWSVVKDVYLATFSFQRYLMWNDLHAHFETFKQNAVVGALLQNKFVRMIPYEVKEEDEGDPAGTLLPLPADSSQYSAIAFSRTGASFVLHGPPGTGKSQTIANVIANALEDGKRVLFVAEKKAALDVVKRRLDSIGIGDFCLELHSDKTDRAGVLKRLEGTLALRTEGGAMRFNQCAEEIRFLREELIRPVLALHKKRRLGISVYQAILLYLKNKDAPDVLDVQNSFYDSLSERKLADCRSRILSAAAAAKECGGVYNSPFENVYTTEYGVELRDKVFCACEVLLAEIKHLRAFLGLFLEFYRQQLSVVTQRKLQSIASLAKNMVNGVYAKYFTGVSEEGLALFYNANRRLDEDLNFYYAHFKSLVELGRDYGEIKNLIASGGDVRRFKPAQAAMKRLSRAAVHNIDGEDAVKYLHILLDIYDAMEQVKSVPLAKNFLDRGGDVVFKRRTEYLSALYAMHDLAAKTFMDYNPDSFNAMCLRAQNGYTLPVLEGYLKASESFFAAQERFLEVTRADRSKLSREDVLDYFSARAGALIDNIDMLSNWCMYRKTAETLKELGCSFVTDALEGGRLTGENVLAGFEKNVYKNFLEINIPSDPDLSRMTAGTLEETVEKFRLAWDEFACVTREKIRIDLISRLPFEEDEGDLAVEAASFRRLVKTNLRGTGLRGMFAEIPDLIKRLAPCTLMSPTAVAQYLQPEVDSFDLVIFDEASQMTTAEAIGAIARAKAAIVAGDPEQLPPTNFFRTTFSDEDDPESEDLESVLDDCLSAGMPERNLLWHYRSKHESLIAFSNGMYYDNRLCTFPSPDGLESRVKLVSVPGVYDRGGTKRNEKEAQALVREIVRRLQDPVLSRRSMGVVTFSSAQQFYVERLLYKEIAKNKLESEAFGGEEPIFVKNLENVQGDERDVILFSVCYGPDASGRLFHNFGPLNREGGWRRLNVAVSRAREEMLVFSSMTWDLIDPSKTTSRGVLGLRAFLEYAERGKTTLAVRPSAVKEGTGVGKYFAAELRALGYDCRVDVGASDFKIDVAVIDPRTGKDFLLAVVFDGTDRFSVKDRNILQIQTLKRANWNVVRVNSVNYYNNPKREVKRVKDLIDKLTGAEGKSGSAGKYAKAYRAVKTTGAESAAFVTGGEHDKEIVARLKEIVAAEEPISRNFLKARCLSTFGILKTGNRVSGKLDSLIDGCAFRKERAMGNDYFYKTDRAVQIGRYRVEKEGQVRKTEEDLTPFEVVSYLKAVLEDRVSVYFDEVLALLSKEFRLRPTERFASYVRNCISYGEEKGVLVLSVSDRITLA